MNKTLVLVNDHPSRDLKGVVLLASELALRGFRTIITPLNLCNHEVWKYTPELVHLSYLRTNNEHFAEKLNNAHILYTVLDTEGGVLEDFSILSRCLPSKQQITDDCSHFFCWGKPLEDYLVKNHFFRPEKISTTGQPRIDYYHESFHATLANQKIAQIGKFFLFNSMFSFSNPRYSTKEQELKNAVRLFNSDMERMKQQQDKEDRAQRAFIELTKKVAAKYPDFKLIYRPHPFESDKVYLEEFKNLPNIIVTNEGPVDSWILHSTAVIQLKCSTAFESRMLHKPVLLPIWIGDLNGDPRINEISHIVENEQEFFVHMDHIKDNNYQLPADISSKQNQIIEEIYFKQDGKAYKRVADTIEQLVTSKKGHTSKSKCGRYKSMFAIHPKEGTKSKCVKYFLKYSGLSNLLIKSGLVEFLSIKKWKKTSKYFEQKNIEDILSTLSKSHPEFKSLSVKKPESRYHFNNSFQIVLKD